MKYEIRNMKHPTLAHFRHFSHFRHSFNYNIFPDTLNYAKQTQCQVHKNECKLFYDKQIRKNGQLVIQTKQTQFKANKAKNKANSNPIKAKTNPIQTQKMLTYFNDQCPAWWYRRLLL